MASNIPQFASLYVGDLHPDVTEAMLYEIFNSVGPVASIRVCRDAVTRRSLGYGYVNFHAVSDAERALDTLNYSSIKGRSCRIMWSQRDPSLRKSGAGNIYVKNLDKNIDNKALYDTFSLFGNILSCKVASNSLGNSYGYGFVHYETEEAAKQAIERVNGMQIGEKTVQVCQFTKRADRDQPDVVNYTNLYIKHFPASWTEEKIMETFAEHGKVTSVALRNDAQGRPFAFVNFEDPEDAKKCVTEMNKMDMRTPEEAATMKEEGKEDESDHPSYMLYVGRAQSKAERQAELRGKITPNESRDKGVNLYVKNLDENTDDSALRELFTPFGQIISVGTPKDERGRCKGFGFVCFANPDEATKAVTEMHLKVVQGKPLYVGLAEKREARQERLRQRYSPGGDKGGKMGKGPSKGGMSGKGGMMMGGSDMGMGMGMNPQGMGGMGMPGMPPQMYGPGGMGMMPRPQGMMSPQQAAAMYGGGKGGMMGPKGPMMGGPQMMAMKGGPMAMPGMMGPMGGMMGKGAPMSMPGMMNPGGMMRPQMPMQSRPPMPTGGPPNQMQPQPQPQVSPVGPMAQRPPSNVPLNAAVLAAAPPSVQKQMIGEKLFPAIAKFQPELAGKITGMMLEMDISELLILLESDVQLKSKVDEALRVLESQKA